MSGSSGILHANGRTAPETRNTSPAIFGSSGALSCPDGAPLVEITVTLTYGEHQAIDVNLTDDQPYNPDVADDLVTRAVKALLDTWRTLTTD